MRILYDGQIYAQQTVGGVNRYFANIINRLPNNFFPTLTTIFRKVKINYPDNRNLKVFQYPRFRPRRISSYLEPRFFKGITDLQKFDIAHPTYYSLLTRQEMREYRYPIVLTVHDMIHEIFAHEIDPKGEEAKRKRTAISAAQAIICVSENTKKDLLERYHVPENRVLVTYLASEIDASFAYGDEPVPFRPYYLYVGNRSLGYKNFKRLLLACSKAVSVNPHITLCIVGAPLELQELQLINELKLSKHIEQYTYVSDTHLAKLYRCSVALVYPSLYEGFGIPPLEAMSCGTAVIASNCSSIPEVVGNAGILFNPQSVDDLANILIDLFDRPLERDRLIKQGYQRAELFDWDKTASLTIDVYRSFA